MLPPPVWGKAGQRLRESPRGGRRWALGRGLVRVPFLLPEGRVSGRAPRSLSASLQEPHTPLSSQLLPSAISQASSWSLGPAQLSHRVGASPIRVHLPSWRPTTARQHLGCSSSPWGGHPPPPSPSDDCFHTPHSREPIGTSLIPTPAAGNS